MIRFKSKNTDRVREDPFYAGLSWAGGSLINKLFKYKLFENLINIDGNFRQISLNTINKLIIFHYFRYLLADFPGVVSGARGTRGGVEVGKIIFLKMKENLF